MYFPFKTIRKNKLNITCGKTIQKRMIDVYLQQVAKIEKETNLMW